jgi:hypothetical protein
MFKKGLNPYPPKPENYFKPGVSGNPLGKPKGTKNLATLIRELEEANFDYSGIPLLPRDLERVKGISPFQAIRNTMTAKAIAGDKHAADWLSKNVYGSNVHVHVGQENQVEATKEEVAEILDKLDDRLGSGQD